jgi:Dolichyl-phosphate-mannose-protein mannosyltransferase
MHSIPIARGAQPLPRPIGQTLESAPGRFSLRARMRGRLPLATLAAAGAVLAWFAVQLGRFLGDPPDLDAMVSMRESLVLYHHGLRGLIKLDFEGIHPPLLELLSSVTFVLFGEEPRSQRLLSIVLFVVVAASVERLLAPWLSAGKRVLAALVVAICPSLAIAMFLVSREGIELAVLAAATAFALRRPERLLGLGAILAVLPLIKETGIALVLPFAVLAALSGEPRVKRAGTVLALPVAAAVVWRIVLAAYGGKTWASWVSSSHAHDGPYVVALRAIVGLEPKLFLRQNLANGLIVNFLWLPALLALATLLLLWRRPAPAALRRAVALVGGLAVVYAWTTLTFPTFTIPRYAAPLTLCVLLLAVLGLPLWPARAQPFVLGVLLAAFALGAWSPADPVSRAAFGVTSVGGVKIYDTSQLQRGPDRMVINFAVLRATQNANGRLRQIYASGATLVTGDCNAMKLGEKLYSVGLQPNAYAGQLPGARPLECVPLDKLPKTAPDGPEKVALVRTPEDDANHVPDAIRGASVIVIH